jgi:hypothetical protein
VELAVRGAAVEERRAQAEPERSGDARILEQEAAREADALRRRLLDLVARADAGGLGGRAVRGNSRTTCRNIAWRRSRRPCLAAMASAWAAAFSRASTSS